MKLLIVAPYISTSKSFEFYQSQQINLASKLKNIGVDTAIISGKRTPNMPDNLEIDNVHIRLLNTSKYFPEKKLNQVLLLGLWKELKKTNFDIVQTTEFHHLSTLMIALFAIVYKKKMVIYQGIYKDSNNKLVYLFTKVWDFLFGSTIKKACVLAICKTSAASKYLKSKGFTNTDVLPVGVNHNLFNSTTNIYKELDNKNIQLLMVGNLIERKNYSKTLKALAILKKNNTYSIKLKIIGKGHLLDTIENEIVNLKLEKDVTLIQQVSNHEMKNYYSEADFTVMFSYNEIFGMTILESMACGCPFISNFEPGPSDIIEDGTNGYKIDSETPEKIAKGIEHVIKTQSFDRDKIETNTKNNFGWSTIALRYKNKINTI